MFKQPPASECVPHEYGPSRVGHGEAQCRWCLGTNRENAIIAPNHCDKRAAARATEQTEARGMTDAEINKTLFDEVAQLRQEIATLREAARETLKALTCGQQAITDTVWVAGDRSETLFDCVAAALDEPEFSEKLIHDAMRTEAAQ